MDSVLAHGGSGQVGTDPAAADDLRHGDGSLLELNKGAARVVKSWNEGTRGTPAV